METFSGKYQNKLFKKFHSLNIFFMLQFDKEHPLADGIFLLKLTTPSHPSLIAMTKGIENLTEDINKSFEYCTPTTNSIIENECTFVFNNDNIFYYTLYFHQKAETYELVIKSYQRCVYFFMNFLKQLYATFCDVKSAYEPVNFFELARILISNFPTTLSNSMKIVFPTDMKQIEFTNDDFSYHHYKPSKFFQPKLYTKIFTNLISSKPILFVSSNASVGCRACFAAFSMLHPLRYSEKFILWLRKDDPRYIEILNETEKSKYMVVATDDSSEIESKFDLVFPIEEVYKTNEKVDEDFEIFTKKIFLMIQSEFINLANKNPYSDVLNLPWTGKNMIDIVNDPNFGFMPKMDALKAFEKSNTVKLWRLKRNNPENLREAFLQCGAIDFESFNKNDLMIIEDYLASIIKLFDDDLHMKSVIKKHMSAVSKALQKFASE